MLVCMYTSNYTNVQVSIKMKCYSIKLARVDEHFKWVIRNTQVHMKLYTAMYISRIKN